MRVWTANLTGRWLCRHISSAGCCLATDDAVEKSHLLKQALDKLIPRGRFPWAQGFPHEADRIFGRMRTLRRRQITTTDLEAYDIVLCSNATDRDYVENLRFAEIQKYGPVGLASVVVLAHCEELSSIDCGNGSGKLNEMIAKIETSIDEFISIELGDWSGRTKRTKSHRTRQDLIDRRSLNTYHPDMPLEEKNFQKIGNETRCSINIVQIAPLSNMVLLSINGPEETVMKAWLLVCHKQHKAQPIPPNVEVPGTHVDALGSK